MNARSGFVVIDFRDCGSLLELFEMYQDFGVLCARSEVRRALLKTGDEYADTHYALRDILRTTTLIAGIPLHLRLAMLARSDASARVCETMREELRALGCNARVFRVEGEAAHWLRLQNNYDPDPELEEFSHPRRSSSAMIAAAPSAGVPRSPGISSSGDNGAS